VLAEVQHTVDDVVIIAQGRLVHASSLEDLAHLAAPETYVESPDLAAVSRLCEERGWPARPADRGLLVGTATAADVGAAAYGAGIELHQLASRGGDLEDVFLRLTGGSR
jgi:ABC-2 type transport system ATP-binding protein